MLETLTFNLTNAPIRRETLQGRQYVVAPMAMLTEGVHAGSGGALLYRGTECKKAAPAWNMKPIVVYHPEINGQGVSACDPDILERQQVGMLMNTRWNGKLRAEAWIDEEQARAVDERVLCALETNQVMEVSTGLFTDNVGEPGEWEGEAYVAEATNHQPDHLALLPDKIGACSVADGAGLLQLNEAAEFAGVDVTRLLEHGMDDLRRTVGNAMSHSNTREALSQVLRERFGVGKETYVYVVDVYDDFVVYEVEAGVGGGGGSTLYRIAYTDDKTSITLSTEDPVEVVRVTEYRTAGGGEFVGNTRILKEDEGMDKKQLVDALITNAATQWEEGDRDALMALDEGALAKMAPVAMEEPAVPEGDDSAPEPKDVPVTMEAYVAAAPEEYRDVLQNGLAAHKAAKDALIKQITDNSANKFSPEFLATKGLEELSGLAALAARPEAAVTTGPMPMFTGAATPANAPVLNEEEAPLVPPSLDFGD